jgi:prefoldin subunit 5
MASALAETVDALAQMVDVLARTLNVLAQTLDTLAQTIDSLTRALNVLAPTLNTVAQTVGTLAQEFDTIAQTVDTAGSNCRCAVNWLGVTIVCEGGEEGRGSSGDPLPLETPLWLETLVWDWLPALAMGIPRSICLVGNEQLFARVYGSE